MNKLIVDGVPFEVEGDSISVYKNKIYVDGKHVTSVFEDTITIRFEGDLAKLNCTRSEIIGNVIGNIEGTSLKINGDIHGDINSTSVEVNGDITGNINATTINIKSKRKASRP